MEGRHASGIDVRRLELRTGRGRVFGPVSVRTMAGTVTAFTGPSGCGKTALLLTLAGRMHATGGTGHVCGLDLAREGRVLRGRVGLGIISGVNDLEDPLTPEQHLAEQRLVLGRRAKRSADVLEQVGLDELARVKARDLDAEQRVRLGIALALASAPDAIVVDDLDRDLDSEQIARIGSLLRSLADDGVTVFVACVDRSSAAFADAVVSLSPTDDSAETEVLDAIA